MEESFVGEIQEQFRIAVPKAIREILGLKVKQKVRVKIEKVKKVV